MKTVRIIAAFLFVLFINDLKAQDCGPIDAARLRSILVELGYTVKDLNTNPGKEKYEVKLITSTLDVPMGFEISPSTNFIWMTVFLGKPFDDNSPKNIELLKQNGNVQPCQFYITSKGNLMIGMALENRAVTNAVLKKFSDMLAKKTSETASYWKNN